MLNRHGGPSGPPFPSQSLGASALVYGQRAAQVRLEVDSGSDFEPCRDADRHPSCQGRDGALLDDHWSISVRG